MKQSFLKNISLIAAIIALCVIALGAFTRLMDAGLGCPDWPGCYGHIIPNATHAWGEFVSYKAWSEMIHRYAVSVLSIFILTIVFSVFIIKQYRTKTNIIFSILLIALTCYQIMLGQWTVTLKLLPIIVSQHLLGGFFILSSLWIIYLSSLKNETQIRHPFIAALTAIGLLLLLLQIALGAWTSTNYASLSCPDFPFCTNENPLMPLQLKAAYNLFSPVGVNYQGGVLAEPIRQTIQIMHRMGALLVSLYLFALFTIGLKKTPRLAHILYAMIGVLLIQLCLGIMNVLFKLPLVTAILHTICAALLLLTLLTYLFYLLQGKTHGVR